MHAYYHIHRLHQIAHAMSEYRERVIYISFAAQNSVRLCLLGDSDLGIANTLSQKTYMVQDYCCRGQVWSWDLLRTMTFRLVCWL